MGKHEQSRQMKSLTIGENRVRVEFNPDALETVSQIKQKSAELINLIDSLRDGDVSILGEKNRLISLSMTAFEEGAMWAVKAATYK